MNSIDEKIDSTSTTAPESNIKLSHVEIEDKNVSRETYNEESEEIKESEDNEIDNDENEVSEHSKDSDLDEYGNEIKKTEKTYTESEVQAMIRDRLSRGQRGQQQEQQIKQQAKDFKYDEDSNQTWEQQLEQFMEGWASKREKKQQEQQWQQQEQQKQAEFESNFNNGMAKYNDFREVVSKQPIDDTMLMATRGMKDPAAFIYAASKKKPAELQRISQISDPYTKMMEIGRLDERMKKEKNNKSNAPKPVSLTKSDTSSKSSPRSLDDKIQKYAEQYLKRH